MLRNKDKLQGTHFRWFTDHKSLIHLLKQPKLSVKQARWLEKIADFDFEIIYIEGKKNILADALSRIYEGNMPGAQQAMTEYTVLDSNKENLESRDLTRPLGTIPSLLLTAISTRSQLRKQTQNKTLDAPTSIQPLAKTVKRVVLRVKPPRSTTTTEPAAPQPAAQPTSSGNDSQRPASPSGATDIGSGAQKAPQAPSAANARTERVCNTSNRVLETEPLELPAEELERVVSPRLTDIVAEARPTLDFPSCLRGRYGEDKFFTNIMENPTQYRQFSIENGLVFKLEGGGPILCIPKVRINEKSAIEIVIDQAHSILAHLGASKTKAYLREQVWWPTMVADIARFCESCHHCKTGKPNNQKPFGILRPLPVPRRPWETIGIDFVGPLPPSKNRHGEFDCICNIVDLLTGMVHIEPAKTTYRAKDIAELVFERVYKLHGLPEHIVSDRDSLFTSQFWNQLNRLIGIKLKMSSAYHPQTDGSTERAQRTITQMIRMAVSPNQKDWVSKLPAVEFAINLARSETTGYAPFFLNHGRMPKPIIYNSPDNSEFEGIRVFAQRIKDAVESAHDAVLTQRVKSTRLANRHRRPAPFCKDDLVYISTKNLSIPKLRARKLVPKYIGPYLITRDFGNESFEVDLPPELKQKGVHPVFHASNLRIHIPNDDRLFPGRSLGQVTGLGDRSDEWAVEKIAGHAGKAPDVMFNVVWKAGDSTWVPLDQIRHLDALKAYLELQNAQNVEDLGPGIDKRTIENVQVEFNSIQLKFAHTDTHTMSDTPTEVSLAMRISTPSLCSNHRGNRPWKKYKKAPFEPKSKPTHSRLPSAMSFPGPHSFPPHLGKFDEPVKAPWTISEPSDPSMRYNFEIEELRDVQHFAKKIMLDDLPRHTAEDLPERYLTIRRLYNMYRSPIKMKPLPPLPPFANLEDNKINSQINRDANKRKNITKNIGEPPLLTISRSFPGRSDHRRLSQDLSILKSTEKRSSRKLRHEGPCAANVKKPRRPFTRTCANSTSAWQLRPSRVCPLHHPPLLLRLDREEFPPLPRKMNLQKTSFMMQSMHLCSATRPPRPRTRPRENLRKPSSMTRTLPSTWT